MAGLGPHRAAAALARGRRARRARRRPGRTRPGRGHRAVRRRRAVRDPHRGRHAARTRRARGRPEPAGRRRRAARRRRRSPCSARTPPSAASGRSSCIAGLQEGLWPNTAPRGGVLGTGQLRRRARRRRRPPRRPLSTAAPLLAEERRLLLAAMGRARSALLITAVDSDGGDAAALPSPFVDELAALATEPPAPAPPLRAPRVLAASALVGRLRAVVCAPAEEVRPDVRAPAPPRSWRGWPRPVLPGPTRPSGTPPARCPPSEPVSSGDDEVVTLSPSTLQTLADCPLRWLLERHGGADGREVRSAVGSLLHALIERVGRHRGAHPGRAGESTGRALPFEARWYAANELASAPRRCCRRSCSGVRTPGTSSPRSAPRSTVDGVVDAGDGAPAVRVRGRIDRLERDAAGGRWSSTSRPASSPVTKDDAQHHAQLAMYQLAVAEGLVGADCVAAEPGGGRLVYLGKRGPQFRRDRTPAEPADPAGAGRLARDGARRPRPPPEVHASWPGSTTAARTARCGPAVRRTGPARSSGRDGALQPGRTGRGARPLRPPPTNRRR